MFHKQPMGFRLEKKTKESSWNLGTTVPPQAWAVPPHVRVVPPQARTVPPHARVVLAFLAKEAKGEKQSRTTVTPQARVVPSSLALGSSLIFGGTTTPLLGTSVLKVRKTQERGLNCVRFFSSFLLLMSQFRSR